MAIYCVMYIISSYENHQAFVYCFVFFFGHVSSKNGLLGLRTYNDINWWESENDLCFYHWPKVEIFLIYFPSSFMDMVLVWLMRNSRKATFIDQIQSPLMLLVLLNVFVIIFIFIVIIIILLFITFYQYFLMDDAGCWIDIGHHSPG